MRSIIAAWIAIFVRLEFFCSGVRSDHWTATGDFARSDLFVKAPYPVDSRVGGCRGSSGDSSVLTIPIRRIRAGASPAMHPTRHRSGPCTVDVFLQRMKREVGRVNAR